MPKPPKPADADLTAFEQEYRSLTSVARSLCVELVKQLNQLLENDGIALGFPIQYRVKSWESLSEKFGRLSLNVKSIKEVQDLVGLRLILLYRRDVEKVCESLANHFTVVRHYDTQERLKQDQFGYSSIHYVVELPKHWLAVPTLAPLAGLQAEIQVRTLAQHIWAEASHSLQYKQEANVPPLVLRSIYRVSALLETVDLEFERVLEQRESYRSEADISGTADALNVDLLVKTLDSLLPAANRADNEDYSDLLKDLTAFQIRTQQQLRTLIEENLPKALERETAELGLRTRSMTEGGKLFGTSAARIRRGVFFTHSGLMRTIMGIKFQKDWANYQNAKLPARRPARSR